MRKLRIGNKVIGNREPAFVIAEVAASHEGSLEQAKRLLEVSREVGADAIKFQIFNADELVVSSHPKYHSFKQIEFSLEQWLELLDYARKLEIIFLADVFDIPSLELMARTEVGGYKIHLTNLANPFMLAAVAKRKKPVFLAVGGALPEEIGRAIEIIKAEGNEDIILMHGYQGYPTSLEEINLRRITTLWESFSLPVGFLDHVDGSSEMSHIAPLVSLAVGACVIEKHITLDRSLKGRDYFSSLEPPQFRLLVGYIREIEKTFGRRDFRLSSGELKYRQEVMKNIVAAIPIPRGTEKSPPILAFKRSSPGLPPAEAPNLLGRTTRVDIEKDEVITWEKVE